MNKLTNTTFTISGIIGIITTCFFIAFWILIAWLVLETISAVHNIGLKGIFEYIWYGDIGS